MTGVTMSKEMSEQDARVILDLVLYHYFDLSEFIRWAYETIGPDWFELEIALKQYFQLVTWEWQRNGTTLEPAPGKRLVFEDRTGDWRVVPDFIKSYVDFTEVV